jgi:CheY-like chemotaxis protein
MPGKKILVIGDLAERRVDIFNVLASDRRLIVTQAVESGWIALEELAEIAPDLIVLDLLLPDVDGLEFLYLVRAKTAARIVVLSVLAPAGSAKAAQALSLGADAVMSLPPGPEASESETVHGRELLAVICSLLELEAGE